MKLNEGICNRCGFQIAASLGGYYCHCENPEPDISTVTRAPRDHDPEFPGFRFCIAMKDGKLYRVFFSEEGGSYFLASKGVRVYALEAKTFAAVISYMNFFVANLESAQSTQAPFVIAKSLGIKCNELRHG